MNRQEKLKALLGEWHDFEIPNMYPRDFDTSLLHTTNILSIIGPRRAGKTYLCYQIIASLKQTLPEDNILYVNFEDERLYPLKGDELTLLWNTYLELFAVDMTKKIYLFLDEIQNIAHWSKWARRTVEQNKNVTLIMTGSSSKLFSKEIATELRGRTISFTVYPLSFKEYLKANGFAECEGGTKLLYGKRSIPIKKQFNTYAATGGFPAVLESARPQELLKEYYNAMFYRDLIERYKIKNIKLLEDYLALLLDQFSCPYSISATAKKLAGFGYSFSKNTLSNFSRYAEDIFLAFELKKFSYKLKNQLRLPKKIYGIDHGLIQAVRFFSSQDYGRVLENIAFISLKRHNKQTYYYSGKHECDFVVVENRKIMEAIQVCATLESAETKKREAAGLLEAMNAHKLASGLILTDREHESLRVENKTIQILPLWYWLLREPSPSTVRTSSI